MTMDRLYVSDLDGTLLQDDALIAPRDYERLERMIAEGLPFTVASARNHISIRQVLRGLRLPLPIVSANGAYITDLDTGRHLHIEPMEPATVEAILGMCASRGLYPFVTFNDGQGDHTWFERSGNGGMDWYIEERRLSGYTALRRMGDMPRCLEHRITQLVLIGREGPLAEFAGAVAGCWDEAVKLQLYENRYEPGWWWLSIHPQRATKGHALEWLLRHLGVEREAVTVFGDHDNDIEMFRHAGNAVATANATERLKAEADLIIGPNTESSVVDYLEAAWTGDDEDEAVG